MKIAVAAESDKAEPRVAAYAGHRQKVQVGLGAEVAVEPGAGLKSGLSPMRSSRSRRREPFQRRCSPKDADIVHQGAAASKPTSSSHYKQRRAWSIAIMDPYGNDAALNAMANAGVSASRWS
jgi:NAD(P) transhydrogenase subunit alpha